jgi:glycine/D-amino acid oxidase-like deaminating enzyme
MEFPSKARFVIVGAGIHGLSTAYHLALELKARNQGSGEDILVLDKTVAGAGASGIACGVVRNNYFQPAMRELMSHSVDVWESDVEAYSYHSVGYMQISPELMHEDVVSIAEQQKEIGYESVLIEGREKSADYMKNILCDWQAQGITSVLHEKRGGYANNTRMIHGLAKKADSVGVTILTGVQVEGFESDSGSRAVTAVHTNCGVIQCEYVIVSAGPWIKNLWELLELPKEITVKGLDGAIHQNIPMWVFWSLQEGTLGVDPRLQRTNDGNMPPVIHVDTDAPLFSCVDGSLITDQLWGIYYKPDFHFGGIQGGAAPLLVATDPDQVAVDPYGSDSPDFVVGHEFAHMWVSALAHCQKRFEGQMLKYKDEPSGGIGAFTPDSFPVFDVFRENCYVIADSNHGFKMIGVGKLVAQEICGENSTLMDPFRFSRYIEGRLHPVSKSPFPWS